jgi:hypothetical protein
VILQQSCSDFGTIRWCDFEGIFVVSKAMSPYFCGVFQSNFNALTLRLQNDMQAIFESDCAAML